MFKVLLNPLMLPLSTKQTVQITVVSSLCLISRSAIHFLTTALGCVSSPLNMEDKTPSSGTAGLEFESLGALLQSRSEPE